MRATAWLPFALAANGKIANRAKNSASDVIDQTFAMRNGRGEAGFGAFFRKNHQPISPPKMIAPTCPQVDGTASVSTAAATARLARGRPAARLRAMPQTA